MGTCNFKNLVELLDNQLDLDEKLEVLSHIENCSICRDAIYQISRDRDEHLYLAGSRAKRNTKTFFGIGF